MKNEKQVVVKLFLFGFLACILWGGKAYAASQIPISIPEDLLKMSGSSKEFYLTNDIEMEGYGNWEPINFSGVFDGNGYEIKHLEGIHGGLFDTITKATIQNLELSDVRIVANSYERADKTICDIGAIAGKAENSIISNCKVTGKIEQTSGIYDEKKGSIGGIIGSCSSGMVEKCCFNGTVTASNGFKNGIGAYFYGANYLGGIVADAANTTIRLCSTEGILEGYVMHGKLNYDSYIGAIGGIAGYAHATKIINCYNLAEIKCNTTADNIDDKICLAGGLVGKVRDNANITYCYTYAPVIGTECTQIGSLFGGISSSNITRLYCSSDFNKYALYMEPAEVDLYKGDSKHCKLSEIEMRTQSSYVNWDFDKTWVIAQNINDGLPYLKTMAEPSPAPSADVPSGQYKDSFYVTLSNNESVQHSLIYYTLDGSEPSAGSSYIYTEPIQITKNCYLKIMAMADGYSESDVVTYKYTINADAEEDIIYDGDGTITEDTIAGEFTDLNISENLSVYVGDSKWINFTYEPWDADENDITWKSSNTRIATVDYGQVTGVSAGTVEIYAVTPNNIVKKCIVTVAEPTLKLKKSSAKLKVGRKIKISASVTPSATITYTSKNKSVATVTAKGVVSAKKRGKATIIVKANGMTKKFKVTVS